MTSVGASNVARSEAGGATRPKNRPWITAAPGAGSCRNQSRRTSTISGSLLRGTARAAGLHELHDRLAEGERDLQRGEGDGAGQQRVVEHRHLDDHPAQALGCHRGDRERRVGSQRGAADDGLVDLEVVQQRDRLLGEALHPVGAHVARAVRAPMAQQVERDDAVAALGQRRGHRDVHALREQQPGQQDRDPRALAVDAVGQAVAVVLEGGHGRAEDSRRPHRRISRAAPGLRSAHRRSSTLAPRGRMRRPERMR